MRERDATLRPRLVRGAIVGAAGALAAALLLLSGILSGFEAKTWDARVRLFAHPDAATSQVALILLDQASFDWGKKTNDWSWPWPREVYSAVVDFCMRAGVKALAFDVLIADPSQYGVSDDQALGESIGQFGRFVAAVFPGNDKGGGATWPAGALNHDISVNGLSAWLTPSVQKAINNNYALFPIPDVLTNSKVVGAANFSQDADGVYRRGRLFTIFDGKVMPSLALAMYAAARETPVSVSVRRGRIVVDGRSVPINSSGQSLLRYTTAGATTHQNYSAAAIIQSDIQLQSGEKPNIDPKELAGKYVLLGFSAPGLMDLRPSPLSPIVPGTEIHATMLDNLLADSFMRDMPTWESILLIALLGIAAGLAASLISGTVGTVLLFVIALPVPIGLSFLSYGAGVWMPLIASELAVVLTLVGANVMNYATEGRQRKYIKNAFQQYLSPAVIEQLIAHPERLQLGGERRELTIFFSDLQGFTGISEGLSPEELTALLNDYLSAMTDIIQEEGGTIDKYEGDAIIAFWNAPLGQEDHAVRAIRATLRCQARLTELRPAFRERVNKDLYMRVGVNTGPAVVGNMGSHTRFDYTMLGDAVNLASRLEGINKQFATYSMMSQATRDAIAGAFPARELSRVAVVGRREPVVVYEPMFDDEFAARKDDLSRFAEALPLFYQGRFPQAIEKFDAIAERDPAARMYARKCRLLADEYRISTTADAPPSGWEGVWVMTEK
ncbi:MAG TPA: adenylate/guanylate cyclase domain-containing protein [Spirochaetia bacterium]|nr:adenylate/guanylate cyclase domain-containing protein [Spirochaetia bacterium]